MIDTTEDAFLGGALQLLQPRHGYRAGADPVLLAAAVDACAGQSVLELGCGVGTATMCLMRRIEGLECVAVERHSGLVELARENASRNALATDIRQADLTELPDDIRARSFDHVLANPPFFDRARGTSSDEVTRESSRGEQTPLEIWVDTAVRRLKPGGHLTLIQRTARLQDILRAMDDRLGDICVLPLAARHGSRPENVIIMSRKGGRGDLRMEPPFVLHDGARHDRDRDSYTPAAKAMLREGISLKDARLMVR